MLAECMVGGAHGCVVVEETSVPGMIAWFPLRIWDQAKWRQFCETPRHRGSFAPRAGYALCFIGTGPEDGIEWVISVCKDCLQPVADEVGVSIDEGCYLS